MSNWHGYFAIEDLNLTADQRQTLIDELRTIGPPGDRQPAKLNHWRTRLDNLAAIFEALFNTDNLSVDSVKARLGRIFNVDPATIGHTTTSQSFSPGRSTPIVTFSHGGENKIRMALFAGINARWRDSRAEVLGFLEANDADWNE